METYEITIDGKKYRTQANSEEGARIKIQTFRSEQQIADEITDEQAKSGVADAILSGLSNDESYKTRWLAEKRFPDLVEQGEDPMFQYFIDADEDIAYVDPRDGKVKKEFSEGLFGADVEDIFLLCLCGS